MGNLFNSKTKEEIAKENLDKLAVEKKFKDAVDAAKACLSSGIFANYKAKLEEAKDLLIKNMIASTESDPVKYGFMCKACLSKLDTLYMLIDYVEKDASRK